MANKIIKTRIQQKHDISENWAKAENFTPLIGEIIIYDDLNKIKIGDGKTNVNNLPFTNGAIDNILDDIGVGSLHQKFDGDNYFNFTGKNPNATSLDPTLTGNINKGATGNYATSFGGKSAAMGKRSLAEGTTTIAKGNYSHVEGDNSVALGNDSHAEGYMTVSKGEQSHAEGIRTISKGTSSHTEGYETESTGAYSHAEGEITKSTGEASHTEGFKTESAGLYSHAEGNNSKVLTSLPSTSSTGGSSSTDTTDDNWNVDEHFGEAAHVEGADNIAIGFASHAEGVNNKAHGHYAHAEGIKNIAGLETEEGVILAPHAEGYNTTASGNYSHSEGYTTEASGNNSHTEGDQTIASGISSHAEGHNTKASNNYSHSEGSDTIASGTSSHSEGGGTKALGDYSHTEGEGTIASKRNQHVQGKFNIEDTANNYAHIIGNGGNTDFRSNAHTVDWNGNAWYAGDIKIGGNSYSDQNAKILATKDYVDNKYSDIDLSEYYTKSETYNKTEIDSKVSSVYKYKGTVPSAMLLPDTNDVGDVYNTIFAGYAPIQKENNYTLTGISYQGNLTTNTEITLTFANNVLTNLYAPVDVNTDIAFWFDNYSFFIGKIISYSNNSYVVKIANLDTTDTIYGQNPCIEAIMNYSYGFSKGSITSVTLQSVHYWQNVGTGNRLEYIPKGGNVAYSNNGWDSLGSTVDTSNFATKNELNNKVNVSDYADYGKFGIIKPGDGIEIVNGVIYTKIADKSLISSRSGSTTHEVITPSNLNFAVKSALSDNNRINDMTNTEKENARGVIGAIGSTELNNYYTKAEVDSKVSSVSKVTTITVPTTGWTTSKDTNGVTYYTINITNSILTSTGYPISDVVLPSDIAAARLQSEAYQKINKITVNNGSVRLYCFDSLPTVSFQIRIQLLYI